MIAKQGHGFIPMWSRLSRLQVEWVIEHRFHAKRRWRFDVACLAAKVAIELEGIFYRKSQGTSRHQTGVGYQNDMEKYNAAAELGWVVLRYSIGDLQRRPVQVVEQVEAVLKARM